jgi:hypothetical protein
MFYDSAMPAVLPSWRLLIFCLAMCVFNSIDQLLQQQHISEGASAELA